MDVLTGTITPKRMPFSNYLSDEYNEIDIFVPFGLPPSPNTGKPAVGQVWSSSM